MVVFHSVNFFGLLAPFMLKPKVEHSKKIFVSDCCSTSNEQIFSYILGKKITFGEMITMSASYYTNTLNWIFIVLVHCVLSGEATNTNCILFGMTRRVHKSTEFKSIFEKCV